MTYFQCSRCYLVANSCTIITYLHALLISPPPILVSFVNISVIKSKCSVHLEACSVQYATLSVKCAVKTFPYAAVWCCPVCPFCFAVSAEYAVGLPHTDSINIVRLSWRVWLLRWILINFSKNSWKESENSNNSWSTQFQYCFVIYLYIGIYSKNVSPCKDLSSKRMSVASANISAMKRAVWRNTWECCLFWSHNQSVHGGERRGNQNDINPAIVPPRVWHGMV